MTISIEVAAPKVEVIFYIREGTNSPYQGRLVYDAETYSKLDPAEIEQHQLEQFEAWKVATAAAQAANENQVDDG